MAFSLSSFLSLSAFPFSYPLHQSRLGTIGVSACVPPPLSSDALALARLLCSALLLLLFPSQRCSNPFTHPSSGGAIRRVVQKLVATSAGLCLCFILFWDWNPVFISPLFVNGSDSGAWNGLAMGAARWDFLCFWTVGAFRDVRHIRECVWDLYE